MHLYKSGFQDSDLSSPVGLIGAHILILENFIFYIIYLAQDCNISSGSWISIFQVLREPVCDIRFKDLSFCTGIPS